MVHRRPVVVLLVLCAALAAALALPALSSSPDGGARAAAAPAYGRLVIGEHGINVRISSHQMGLDNPGGGAAQFGPITVARTIDGGSPTLLEDVATGVHVPEVVVRVFKSNGDPRVTYTLEDVVVTGFHHGGSQESLSFAYGQITIAAGNNSYCFDVVQRRDC